MRHRLVASLFMFAILELAVVSAKNVVEGKTTVFDKCMVLMTNRPDLWSEKASRVGGKGKLKEHVRILYV